MAKSFTQTGIETDLHAQITKEAAHNKQSFSAQIRSYIVHNIKLEEQVNELREEIRKLTDVN